MNRYSPHYNQDEQRTEMSIDEKGSWVHVTYVEELKAERDEARKWLEGICEEFEKTVAYADWRAAGSKGMSVPFHGDFASVVQLPSAISRMRWWAREFRRVLGS